MFFGRKPVAAEQVSTSNEAAPSSSERLSAHGGGSGAPLSRLELLSLRLPKPYVVPLAGGLAGAAAGMVSCPLDVIKTKLQAQGGFRISRGGGSNGYRGVSGTAAIIWREEGLRGMYRGLGPMLLGYVPTWAVYLTVYNRAQAYFRSKTESYFLANIYASLCGGACSTMVTNPIWVIKTRLMSQSGARAADGNFRSPWHYRNTLDAARKMYTTEGLLSFYSGLTPALFGLTHVAIQFPLYEVFKEKFTGVGVGQTESEDDRATHFYGISLAVFLSKVCASTATYPHEVVRTRLQTQQRSPASALSEGRASGFLGGAVGKPADYGRPPDHGSSQGRAQPLHYRGTLQTIKAILVEEGWRGFYAGLGTNLIRAVPSAMTTIVTFEYLKETFFQLQTDAESKRGLSGAIVP